MSRTEGPTSLQHICLQCLAVYKHCLGEGPHDHPCLFLLMVPFTQNVQMHMEGTICQHCNCAVAALHEQTNCCLQVMLETFLSTSSGPCWRFAMQRSLPPLRMPQGDALVLVS